MTTEIPTNSGMRREVVAVHPSAVITTKAVPDAWVGSRYGPQRGALDVDSFEVIMKPGSNYMPGFTLLGRIGLSSGDTGGVEPVHRHPWAEDPLLIPAVWAAGGRLRRRGGGCHARHDQKLGTFTYGPSRSISLACAR